MDSISSCGASCVSLAAGFFTETGAPKSEYVVIMVPSDSCSTWVSMANSTSRPWSSTLAVNGTALALSPRAWMALSSGLVRV